MVSSSVVLPMFLYLRGAKPWSSKEVWGGEVNREASMLQWPQSLYEQHTLILIIGSFIQQMLIFYGEPKWRCRKSFDSAETSQKSNTPQNMPSSERVSEEENKINTYVVFVRG